MPFGISAASGFHTDLTRSKQTQSAPRKSGEWETPIRKVPGDDFALGIDAGANHIQLRRAFGLPAMLIIPHPLHTNRFADRARKQGGIFRNIIGAHAAVTAGSLAIKNANVLFRESQQLGDGFTCTEGTLRPSIERRSVFADIRHSA